MSITLPHPHGTSAGQIANGAAYAVDDTPGSTGGRFVGFGEAGTSRIANRSAWALSQNIDVIFTDILSVPISVNAALAFTSGVGGQDEVQIVGESVFCGDSSYPGIAAPADPEGMHSLFSVLDDQYNPLSDSNGNEVRAFCVDDSTDATVVYKTGYVTSPWVHFCIVDPVTGDIVSEDYSIPEGTAVRLIYGVQTTLKDLPNDYPDAFTRFRSLTGEEIPAGVILQDGTRPMTGDLDLSSHNIVNCQSIVAPAESALDLISSTLGLQLDPTSESFGPTSTSAAITLGSAAYPWPVAYISSLNSLVVASDKATLTGLAEGGSYDFIFAQDTKDYYFMEDFGGAGVRNDGDLVGDYYVSADGIGNVLHTRSPSSGRNTVAAVTVSGQVALVGPTLDKQNYRRLIASAAVCLDEDSSLVTTGNTIFGLNYQEVGSTIQHAVIVIDETGIMTARWSVYGADETIQELTPSISVGAWYNLSISFGISTVTFTAVEEYTGTVFTYTADFFDPAPRVMSIGLRGFRTTNVGPTDYYVVYVDYLLYRSAAQGTRGG